MMQSSANLGCRFILHNVRLLRCLGSAAIAVFIVDAMYAGPSTDVQPFHRTWRAPEVLSEAARPDAGHSHSGLLSNMPLRFESNVGQTDERVDSIARGDGYTLYLAGASAVLRLKSAGSTGSHGRSLRMTLVGASRASKPTHLGAQPGVANYLTGADRSKWRNGVRSYSTVKYTAVYPGIDVLFYGNPNQLEHDFVVAPGVDPSMIAMAFDGADSVSLDQSGDVVVKVGGTDIRQKRPVVYQRLAGSQRRDVGGRYIVEESAVRFEIGEYDPTLPLVIDPVTLVYSTYLGGTAGEDAIDVASDATGSAYLLGLSASLDYPDVNALQPAHAGGTRAPFPGEPPWMADNVDLVLSKLTPDGQAFVYSTYLGGAGDDSAFALAVTPSGEPLIGGSLPSGLPPAPGYEHNCPCDDGFYVAKLNASGTGPVYVAKFNAGAGSDVGVDGAGHAFVLGGGGVYKLNADGTALMYATAVAGGALGVGPDGSAAVTGFTNSLSFPTVAPFQEALHGRYDATVTGLTPDGTVRFASYLGGLLDDRGSAVAVDAEGSIYVTGTTASQDFPTYNASQPSPGGNGREDMFVTKIASSGALIYSTYLGGGFVDMGVGIVVDSRGHPYIVGRITYLRDPDFWPGYYPEFWNSDWDVSVTKLDVSGALLHSALIGGSRNDRPVGIAIGPEDSVYIGGTTYGGFPLKDPLRYMSLSPITHNGIPRSVDMFLSRVALRMTVSAAVPAAVAADHPARVALTGAGFSPGMRVFVAGQWATGVIVNDGTSISVMVPALSAGLYDVLLVSADGELATLPGGLMYGRCSFDLSLAPQEFLAVGGTRSVPVYAVAPQCGWTATANVDWISVQPGTSLGSTDLRLTVAPNMSNAARSGVLTIADKQIAVTQARSSQPDLNTDGRVDLLWQHQTDGRLGAWLMDGDRRVDGRLLSPDVVADTNWKIAGTGDFDGDGQLDLMWQNIRDGSLAAWLMDGLALRSGRPLVPSQVADPDWRIHAVGDLNADGHPDLIWQHHGDGRIAVWYMNGLTLVEGRLLDPAGVTDTNWWIVGAADFTRDGRLDLVWEHQIDGRLAVWEMDGPALVSGRVISRRDADPAAEVKIRAVADFDGDGRVDLMGEHVSNGHLWFCQNTELSGGDFQFLCNNSPSPIAVDDANWRIVGPR